MDPRPEVQTSDSVKEVNHDPAGLCVGPGARRASKVGWRYTSQVLGPAGGGAEVLACIVPGREPCFLLPGTPRWRQGARGFPSSPPVLKAGGGPNRGQGSQGQRDLTSAAASRRKHQAAAREDRPGATVPDPRFPPRPA